MFQLDKTKKAPTTQRFGAHIPTVSSVHFKTLKMKDFKLHFKQDFNGNPRDAHGFFKAVDNAAALLGVTALLEGRSRPKLRLCET